MNWQSIPEVYLWIIDTTDGGILWTFFFLLHVICWFMMGLEVALMDVKDLLGINQVNKQEKRYLAPFLEIFKE